MCARFDKLVQAVPVKAPALAKLGVIAYQPIETTGEVQSGGKHEVLARCVL